MILLMLDYDGTLVPIRERPELAVMPKSVRAVLIQLQGNPEYELAVISGRSLADIKNMVAMPGIVYAGCHGLEIESPQWKYQQPEALAMIPLMQELEGRLKKDLAGLPAVWIENKRLTLAIHYRSASSKESKKLESCVQALHVQYQPQVRLDRGRKVYEFKPDIQWGKGDVVDLLMDARQRHNPYPIYIGDDLTDESAFRAVAGCGLSILVDNHERPKLTGAVMRVRSVSQVKLFLRSLI